MTDIKNENIEVVVTKEAKTMFEKVLDAKKQAPSESPEIEKLAAALAKCQGELKGALKDGTNPFLGSSYSLLADIVAAAQKPMADNGLSVINRTITRDSKLFFSTRLMHESGQWMESCMQINLPNPNSQDKGEKGVNVLQAFGKTITYLRRYHLTMMVGVVSSEGDDDGEGAMQLKDDRPATPAQLNYLNSLLSKADEAKKTEIAKLYNFDESGKPQYFVDASGAINHLLATKNGGSK